MRDVSTNSVEESTASAVVFCALQCHEQLGTLDITPSGQEYQPAALKSLSRPLATPEDGQGIIVQNHNGLTVQSDQEDCPAFVTCQEDVDKQVQLKMMPFISTSAFHESLQSLPFQSLAAGKAVPSTTQRNDAVRTKRHIPSQRVLPHQHLDRLTDLLPPISALKRAYADIDVDVSKVLPVKSAHLAKQADRTIGEPDVAPKFVGQRSLQHRVDNSASPCDNDSDSSADSDSKPQSQQLAAYVGKAGSVLYFSQSYLVEAFGGHNLPGFPFTAVFRLSVDGQTAGDDEQVQVRTTSKQCYMSCSNAKKSLIKGKCRQWQMQQLQSMDDRLLIHLNVVGLRDKAVKCKVDPAGLEARRGSRKRVRFGNCCGAIKVGRPRVKVCEERTGRRRVGRPSKVEREGGTLTKDHDQRDSNKLCNDSDNLQTHVASEGMMLSLTQMNFCLAMGQRPQLIIQTPFNMILKVLVNGVDKNAEQGGTSQKVRFYRSGFDSFAARVHANVFCVIRDHPRRDWERHYYQDPSSTNADLKTLVLNLTFRTGLHSSLNVEDSIKDEPKEHNTAMLTTTDATQTKFGVPSSLGTTERAPKTLKDVSAPESHLQTAHQQQGAHERPLSEFAQVTPASADVEAPSSSLVLQLLADLSDMPYEISEVLACLGVTTDAEVCLSLCLACPLGVSILKEPEVYKNILLAVKEQPGCESNNDLFMHMALMYNLSSIVARVLDTEEKLACNNTPPVNVSNLLLLFKRFCNSLTVDPLGSPDVSLASNCPEHLLDLLGDVSRHIHSHTPLGPQMALKTAALLLQLMPASEDLAQQDIVFCMGRCLALLQLSQQQQQQWNHQIHMFRCICNYLHDSSSRNRSTYVGAAVKHIAVAAELGYTVMIMRSYQAGPAIQSEPLSMAVMFDEKLVSEMKRQSIGTSVALRVGYLLQQLGCGDINLAQMISGSIALLPEGFKMEGQESLLVLSTVVCSFIVCLQIEEQLEQHQVSVKRTGRDDDDLDGGSGLRDKNRHRSMLGQRALDIKQYLREPQVLKLCRELVFVYSLGYSAGA
ncbi:hypothetical protein CEUSTIGMA_g3448.t1 [Chlamydomonas eustigma]|uniref:Uncharacterized protein n=1 Tax=Chlamydomonas eustigma TaxID=1157962 RepID=A0A250WYZ6_9CHLO|nr:hypothetical protein CEUSTIGMA_g3448.t1 [Chlamydomonas eustigma]|eukprot:GAX76005.1 hypothetical protein CEUSTIGMA_g3448.t1 [Chlamydomonas eustigma]